MIELAKRLEAYETEQWPIRAILKCEILTTNVIDPCCGFDAIARTVEKYGHSVKRIDIHKWAEINGLIVKDYLSHFEDLSEKTVIMNPPFSLACQFVDHSRMMNARKIICFQRYAWREGTFKNRGKWWEENPPCRIWLCGDRAQCKRFDLRHEQMAKPPTAHAWFVWERDHRGAEITRALFND